MHDPLDLPIWRPVLQGLSAAGATYIVGTMLLTIASNVHDVLSH